MILIVTAVFPPEPVVSAQISHDLATVLSLGNDMVVICPMPTRPAGTIYKMEDDSNRSFRKVVLKSFTYPGSSFIGRMIESISFGQACKKFIKEHSKEISVIYANTWPLFAQLSVAKACRKFNLPLVLHVQDIYPETLTDKLGLAGVPLKKLLLPIDQYVLRTSRTVVVIGQKMAEFLSSTRGIKMNKIAVINNWQDELRFTAKNHNSHTKEKFIFMYLGSLSPSANIESIIVAFGKAGLKNSRFIIAGNGNSKKSCINSASKYPHLEIEFIDAPSESTMELLSLADVLVLPLKKGVGKYSIPSKLAGYMHASKPVLAYIDTDSDAANIVTNAGCGWVIAAGNESELVMKMRELETTPGTALSMIGNAGRSYALKNLSKKTNLIRLVQIIEQETQECNAQLKE
jgi:glycosyltransferase involved in cell wall biosynthesis